MSNISLKWLFVLSGLAAFIFISFLVAFSLWIEPSDLRFNYEPVLIFFFVASLVVMAGMEIMIRLYQGNSSYVFLLTVFVKIGFFVLLFNKSVFNLQSFFGTEKAVLILPMLLFLFVEALFLMKRMNT